MKMRKGLLFEGPSLSAETEAWALGAVGLPTTCPCWPAAEAEKLQVNPLELW